MTPRLRLARKVVIAATVCVWLFACFLFWQQLVIDASDSPELYTRSAVFQLFNFLVQYFWFCLLVLAIAVAAEWVFFWLAGRIVTKQSSEPRSSD